ncbi:2-aminoethylphosphonate--pyruvate transaminase [Bacillus sp. Xin]|uniref:2-aminoethylphosphonate--pyruvate transaminase n=1 Tax=unclassified Bacillus (in: firmicutes) TaxID=185979 RepID=UPI001572C9DC|nr:MULTISPECIES: 2-aminoethylphosphonate--pyruvate transaminase [unclassified Bacillus (in: firmicutes)]MBC6975743.1 2-aminoethylphosphonate--pyruvate transaminase [Bacillus sp. Xin]NSW35254.1 2-aminoethylphosphonate--pyruvate transaminase [Bacillus sp. Xin1]
MNNNHYLLLTPGPLTTTKTVKEVMLYDWCTWDTEYNIMVQEVRSRLVALATKDEERYTTVLMQGSGTFSVESVIGSVIPKEGKLLVCTNGAYGKRIVQMAEMLHIDVVVSQTEEWEPTNLVEIEDLLQKDQEITHVVVVHCETTTGIINPIADVCNLGKQYGKVTIVDAMSSFGGIEMDVSDLQIDFMISSANKCIQGVPGFGFVIAKRDELEKCKGQARSLSLDLYDQWETMEVQNGKWRFTSPTHIVRAFYQALLELEEEGGVKARNARYRNNQQVLVKRMREVGFQSLVGEKYQSPIITSFIYPEESFQFNRLYNELKQRGFVIYPGKISKVDTFRIGNIGDVHEDDIHRLVDSIAKGAVIG